MICEHRSDCWRNNSTGRTRRRPSLQIGTSRVSAWRARAWTHRRLCTLEGFCMWSRVKWILHLDGPSVPPLWFIQGCNSIKKRLFIRRPRYVFLATLRATAASASRESPTRVWVCGARRRATTHSFLFPNLLWNTNQTPLWLFSPFFFSLQLCTQTCKNYRQITRPSTPGVFRRWNTVIISQQKYLFQSPYLQKTKQKT